MSDDVITKLLSDNPYKNGNTAVWINEISGIGSGEPSWVQEYTQLSGIENSLTERFDDINYYSGSGVY
jgi:hypothetical protein